MKLKPPQEEQAKQILAALELFAGCTPEQIQTIVSMLDAREAAKGKTFLMDQEIARTLFILVSGWVGVYKRVGGERKELATLQAPNFFGERSMFEESPASALVKSEAPCLVFALERTAWDQIVAKHPELPALLQTNMAAVRAKRLGPVTPSHEGES